MKAPLQKLELTWIGKGQEFQLEPRILLEQPELAAGDPQAENMLIHGDNLLALKALEQDFAGKIKCIYIDPPYNTGSAFEHYDDGMEHSLWLSLMKQRLGYLKQLLTKDGSIFIHLDDNEIDYCKVMLDELFGRNNFVSRITVIARSPSAFSTVNPGVFKAAEYILWYAKNKDCFVENRIRVKRLVDRAYNQFLENPDSPVASWRIRTLKDVFESTVGRGNADSRFEKFVVDNAKHVFRYTAISESGAGQATLDAKRLSERNPGQIIEVAREEYDNQYILKGQQLAFYEKNIAVIDGERVASSPLTNVWTDIAWEGIANEGSVSFKKGKKPEKLIKRCFELATNPGDWVLDSFLGSGTTAAVAHKMGRRWVGVELGEHARTHCLPRLQKVVSGEDQGGISKAVGWQGGGGFKFYTLAPSLLNKDQYDNWVISTEYNAQMLAAALAKQEGFRYQPDPHTYWKQARSSEHDFLFTTTQFVTVQTIDQLAAQLRPEESLLIACRSYQPACAGHHQRITLKKIPQLLLGRCEFGRDDYSLHIVQVPSTAEIVEDEPAEEAPAAPKPKQGQLF